VFSIALTFVPVPLYATYINQRTPDNIIILGVDNAGEQFSSHYTNIPSHPNLALFFQIISADTIRMIGEVEDIAPNCVLIP
jgi:hypothetical protein